jgi:hypothetical protein
MTTVDFENEIRRVIGECAGAVSMCWDPRPIGVFDSTQAATYVEGAVARVLSVRAAEAARDEPDCGCWECDVDEHGRRMFVCEVCGNKRCPHATDHRNSCTSSNDVGQTAVLMRTPHVGDKPNLRIERRQAGPWEVIEP